MSGTKRITDKVFECLTDTPRNALDIAEELCESRARVHSSLTGLVQAKKAMKTEDGYVLFFEHNPLEDMEREFYKITKARLCQS